MKLSSVSALIFIGALSLSGVYIAAGQANAPVTQNVSAPPVVRQAPRVVNVRPSAPVAPRIQPAVVPSAPRTFNPYRLHTITQPVTNLPPNYSPVVRNLNPSIATIREQQVTPVREPQTVSLDPTTRVNEMRTLPAIRDQGHVRNENTTLAELTAQRHVATGGPTIKRDMETPDPRQETVRQDAARHEMARKWRNRTDRHNYFDVSGRHHREWHDRDWWHDHCHTIVFVTTGYYFLDGSYWYPAWGYDPLQTYYDYDGPIYTYNDLLPDEVISNVQVALQDAGYYLGAVTGSLNVELRAALVNFQTDYGLPITGAIDEATVQTLGLN